jgi:hypothetical protein
VYVEAVAHVGLSGKLTRKSGATLSRLTLSSLQAQTTRVILSGFSPSNCTEKDKEKTGLPDLPIQGPVEIAK